MKASMSTINSVNSQYGGGQDMLAIGIDELTRLATNRLGGLEGVENYGVRFDGVVVAKVVECAPHDNSDHLHVCMIDAGDAHPELRTENSNLIQVVCGAPNVREGLTVAWIPPGATLPSSHDEAEPFVLGKREIRGKLSNGMLASPSELGLFDNHDGILEINEVEVGAELTKPGTEFKKLYGLDDVVLDFENKMFTHRPDCFGQIGLARELAGIQGLKYTSPEWYLSLPTFKKIDDVSNEIFNEVESEVPRIMTVVMKNVTVGPSPVWLQAFLTRIGGKPVNNVVDISNYIMHVTGQPTHAYDLGKLAGAKIGARRAKKGEEIALLNGKTITLTNEDVVIADGKVAIGVAGIMGGSMTEVDDSTTDILLEVATFDMYTIRKTAMRNGLFTDAFTRFSKGQSPLQNDRVMYKFMEMLTELTGAKQASSVCDVMSKPAKALYERQFIHEPVVVSADFINSRLGTSLAREEIEQILLNVEMTVEETAEGMQVTAPFWRTDIELKEDVVEEVGRLYGFDQLALKLPMRSIKPAMRNELNDFKTMVRNRLSAAGANEVLSYSFVHGDILQKVGLNDVEGWCYHLRNALSPDLQYYRPSLMPSLLPKVHPNLKSDIVRSDDNEFAIYEIGKVHVKKHLDEEGLPKEMERLAFVFAADDKTANRKYNGSAMYMAKHYLLPFLKGDMKFSPLESNEFPITAPYEKSRSASISIDGQVFGVVGEFRTSVRKALKLPEYTAGFELDLSLLKEKMQPQLYSPIGTFPKTQQDITLAIDESVPFSDVMTLLKTTMDEVRKNQGYEYRLAPKDIYNDQNSGKTNLTFRIWLWHPNKTLKTEETNILLDIIATSATLKLGAARV